MKRRILILTFLAATLTGRAAYYSINYDNKTVQAMVEVFAAEALVENFYSSQISKILDHYEGAELATAGILASKYLDRKAQTDTGIMGSSTENYYYQRIYSMVSEKIMPKIWTVSGLMLKRPQNAIYWGPYIMKVCTETENLCKQFESVVSNGRLSFRDIAFLKVRDEVAKVLDISSLGNVDLKQVFDNFAHGGEGFTKENLKEDADRLYQMGVNLASSGFSNLSENILQKSSFNNLFQGKYSEIINIVNNYSDMFQKAESVMGGNLTAILGDKGVAGLFNVDSYNTDEWSTDYARETMGQYYTQRYYIYRVNSGSETLCDYSPSKENDAIMNSDEWYRISTSDQYYSPTAAETEAALSNSESHAGWSRAKVKELQSANDGYTYNMNYYRNSYYIWRGSKDNVISKAFAYDITVTKSWYKKIEVYEDTFDSYTMDLSTFLKQMQVHQDEFNRNEEGYTYMIGSDAKHYYQSSDAQKTAGAESASISVTCHDGTTIGEGTTQYKCSDCGGSVSDHTRHCTMATTLTDNHFDTSEIDNSISDANTQISMLQSQISALETENNKLMKQIREASVEDAARLRQQYNANSDKKESLSTELETWKQKLEDLRKAKEEATDSENAQTDDYYRIPAIMQDCKKSYNLTWNNDGHWEGNTYVCTSTMPKVGGTITFKAEVSIARKPKYFLFIKIARAIVQISWKLSSEYTDTQVIDIVQLDPSKSDQEKANEVNERIRQVAADYPNCDVSVSYAKAKQVKQDDTEDVQHLLWASDRLEIARDIDSRITAIYAQLVSIEKMMNYRISIIDVLKQTVSSNIDDEQGKRHTLLEKCLRRWRRNASLNGSNAEDEE